MKPTYEESNKMKCKTCGNFCSLISDRPKWFYCITCQKKIKGIYVSRPFKRLKIKKDPLDYIKIMN